MVPYLWRADQSFRNSVTGSGSIAKCSSILQDSKKSLENLLVDLQLLLLSQTGEYRRLKFRHVLSDLWPIL